MDLNIVKKKKTEIETKQEDDKETLSEEISDVKKEHSNHEGQELQCDICGAIFQRRKNLLAHERTIHEREKIMCEVCDYGSPRRGDFIKHQKNRHGIVKEQPPEVAKSLNCEKCNYVGRVQGSLRDHILYKHEGKKHQCIKCPSSFVRERDLKRHTASKHKYDDIIKNEPLSLSPNSSPCDQNTGNYNMGMALTDPVIVKNMKVKSNQCNLCDYASSLAGNLRKHMKKHTGEKSNKCNLCHYASSRAGDLRRHMKMHTGEKSNKCNFSMKN